VTSPFLRLVLTPDGEVNETAAGMVLEKLTRPQLKRLLVALRQELKRRRVYVTVGGEPDAAVAPAVGEQYPGRTIDIERDESLGGGVRISAGDDIMDASIRGYIRKIIGDLEAT